MSDEEIELRLASLSQTIGPTRAEWYAEACKMECDANSDALMWACRFREIAIEAGSLITDNERLANENAELRRDAAKMVKELLQLFDDADEQRLKETDEAHDEAAKWRDEGDWYGWNFHEGRSAGTTGASIIFFRVKRKLEAIDAAIAKGAGT